MRTKDQILSNIREDIRDVKHRDTAALWIQYRLIEVLLDIRDILEQLRTSQLPPKDNPIREKWRNEVKKTREERDENKG